MIKLFFLCLLIYLFAFLGEGRSARRLKNARSRISMDDQLNKYLHNSQKNSKDEEEDYWHKCKPGVKIDVGKRIVGGEVAEKNAWPWQVHIYREDDDYYHPICGGSVLSPDTILTAAHCVLKKEDKSKYEASVFRVIAGDYIMDTDKDGKAQISKINYIHVHPKNNAHEDEADLAILKLATKLIFDENVTNVCLPIEFPEIGRSCYATGWGHTQSAESNLMLRQVKLPIISRRDCEREYKDSLLPGMLCAGYMEGGRDTCQGDSGGPLVCQNEEDRIENKWRLQGVTSWGEGCAERNFPGVYADVFYYRDWLSKFVKM